MKNLYLGGVPSTEAIFRKNAKDLNEIERMMVGIIERDEDAAIEKAEDYPEEEPEHGTARKLVADLWIDDRNLGGLPDWGVIYNMIHTGHPYEPAPQGNMEDLSPKKKKGFFARLFND